jgi:hypothetical protein
MNKFLLGETNDCEKVMQDPSLKDAKSEQFRKSRQIDYNPLSFDKKKRVELLENIEKMCLNFEETFDRNSKQSLKNQRYLTIDKKSKPIQVPRMKFIISELKKRINSLPNRISTYITPTRMKIKTENFRQSNSNEIKIPSLPKVESHEFTLAPRLSSPISHNVSRIEALYPNKNSVPEVRINLKKTHDVYTEDFFIERKKKISLENKKGRKIKEKKKEIDKEKHDYYLRKFQKKIQLFELRINKEEVYPVKKAWSLFFVVSGFCLTILVKAKIKKFLRSRWEILLGRFVLISRFLARFMIKLKAKRRIIINQKLNKIAPAFDEFFRVKILEQKKFMQDFINGYHNLPGLSKLMVKVKFCSVKVQRKIRNFIVVQRNRISTLMVLWDKLYQQLIHMRPEKTAAYERLGPISKEMILIYLHRFIKKSVKNYNSEKMKKIEECKENENFCPVLKIFTRQKNLLAQIEHALKAKEMMVKRQKMKKYIEKITKEP